MRTRLTVLVAAIGLVAGLVALISTALSTGPVTSDDTHFVADGRPWDCGPARALRLHVYLQYPGTIWSVSLDGEKVGMHGLSGNAYNFVLDREPEFPCSDSRTHTVSIDTGHTNAIYTGCDISLEPAILLRVGYNSHYPDVYDAGERTCDVTWTD